ncbi:MAG TPA: aldehyde dehydrogenase family protein [Candidatus Paceibacterota bacterium]
MSIKLKSKVSIFKTSSVVKNKLSLDSEYIPYTFLDFPRIEARANQLANTIEANFENLTDILLKYESYEVVKDEVARTLDLLRNLKENKKYFRLRVGRVVTFLPRNQPLYAFTCFVIVPSLMASEVHLRIPHSMQHFFTDILKLLDIHTLFPNIFISSQQRLDFLMDQSAIRLDPKTGESKPLTDVVIFTGIPMHADQLRLVFDKRVLFISNGAGHNPVVISKDANLVKAVEAVTTLQFYNQGQDCAAPNAILVHKKIFFDFLDLLRNSIRKVKVGHYTDKTCQIGPISDPDDLVRIQDLLTQNHLWLDSSNQGIIRTRDAIVEPTIICKPLKEGGNFSEIFAPIVFVQTYTNDNDLKDYFENPSYAQNAMYITLYGTSRYIINLIDRPIKGKVLHNKSSLIHNTHLHAPGIERGTQPYGGNGHGASSISINKKITPMATLPQRDIYERIAKPILAGLIKKSDAKKIKDLQQRHTIIQKRDVEKLLRLRSLKTKEQNQDANLHTVQYLDTRSIEIDHAHYIKIKEKNIYKLLKEKNAEYIASLGLEDIKLIRILRTLLSRKATMSLDKFCSLLYNIPKEKKATNDHNKIRQHRFFQHIYQLLLGKIFGPKLGPFLWEVKNEEINNLLDV